MDDRTMNVRRRRLPGIPRKNLSGGGTPPDGTTAGQTGLASPAVMNCLPCAALVVDAERRITAVNDRFRGLFGLKERADVAGEAFAELARRLTLQGNDGLLALGDSLAPGDAELEPLTHIVLASGHSCEARAARLGDGTTLITIAYTDRGPDDLGNLIGGEIIDNLPGARFTACSPAPCRPPCSDARSTS